MCLQVRGLHTGQSPRLGQLGAYHVVRSLGFRIPARALPNTDDRPVRVNKAVYGVHEVILEPAATELAIGKDVEAKALLSLQHLQDRLVL